MSGPITGTISMIPVKIPIRSQNGSPIVEKQIESTVATRTIKRSRPRTYAPSFRSIRSQVPWTTFAAVTRDERRHDTNRVVALEDPVRRCREREEDAEGELDADQRHLERGIDEHFGFRELVEPSIEPGSEPTSSLRARVALVLGAADRLLDLVDRPRDDRPQDQSKGGDERGERNEDPDPARDTALFERLDPPAASPPRS